MNAQLRMRNQNRWSSPDIQESAFNINLTENLFDNNNLKLPLDNNYRKYSSINYFSTINTNNKAGPTNVKKIISPLNHRTNLNYFITKNPNSGLQDLTQNKMANKNISIVRNFSGIRIDERFKTIILKQKLEALKKMNKENLKVYTKKKKLSKFKTILPLNTDENLVNNYEAIPDGENKMEGYTEMFINDRIEYVKTSLSTITRVNTENNKYSRNIPVINGRVNLNFLYSKEDTEKDKTSQFAVRIVEKNGEAAYEYYKKSKQEDKILPSSKSKLSFNNYSNKNDKIKIRIRENLPNSEKNKISSIDIACNNNLFNKNQNKTHLYNVNQNNFLTDQKPLILVNDFILIKDKVINRICGNNNGVVTISDKMNEVLMKRLKRMKKELISKKMRKV